LGFAPLPLGFFAALVAMVAAYLALVEAGKRIFYRASGLSPTSAPRALPAVPLMPARDPQQRHLLRRASRFSSAHQDPTASASAALSSLSSSSGAIS
jgi:Mg2+-importing ATPase